MIALSEDFLRETGSSDHFNLVTLEDQDLYPDGRELGENYTFGPWLMGPCAASGKLDCMHCHTSSGRNKHAGADADRACLPCHEKHVKDPAAHSFHKSESPGSRCVSCHMPETEFARMRRHDHTLLPRRPGHHRVRVTQRLQPLPPGSGCRMGRRVGQKVVPPGLPGAAPPQARLVDKARKRTGRGSRIWRNT